MPSADLAAWSDVGVRDRDVVVAEQRLIAGPAHASEVVMPSADLAACVRDRDVVVADQPLSAGCAHVGKE